MNNNNTSNHTASRKQAKNIDNKSLWEFAVEVYSAPEVEALSLDLQEKYHANVNIILWCCWLKREDISLSVSWLDDVLIKIDTVSQLTVASLRDVRRQLKEGGSFTKVQARTINKHILNAELLIEKVLLHRLQDLTRRFLELNDRELVDNPEVLDLRYYFDFLQIPDAELIAENITSVCDKQLA